MPLRVLKGVAVASIDEPDPSWRSYGDVDVLVPPERFLEAVDVLAEAGCRPAVDPVGWGWIARHGKSLTLIHPSGAQIDLHRQLAIGPFGARLRAADLFELGRPFTVGGRPLLALADVHRFAHACYHAMLGGTRGPRHRRDVLLLAAAVTPRQFEDEAVRGWSRAVVASALGWADPELRVVSPAWGSWLSTESLSEDDERLLRAYRGSFRTVALAELGDRPGMLSKVAYAASLVWPSRANLAARNRRRRDHLAELVRAVPPLFRRGTGGRD